MRQAAEPVWAELSVDPAGTAGILLHGVDFSGADSGGAAKIRVVERELSSPRSAVVVRGQFDRTGLVRAIRASASDGRAHLWRVDAPSGLPLATLAECGLTGDWMAVAEWMRGLGSPRGWRKDVREHTRREPRRVCDAAAATPLAPMNLRVFKQTWTFMCEVLLPLAEAGVSVEPMRPVAGARTVVCEGCPASVLAARGWARRGYKGAGEPPARVRAETVRELRNNGMTIPPAVAEQAIADQEGDLLDALLLVTEPAHTVVPREAIIEGWVY